MFFCGQKKNEEEEERKIRKKHLSSCVREKRLQKNKEAFPLCVFKKNKNKSKEERSRDESKNFFLFFKPSEEEEGCASLFLVLRESFDTRFIYIQKNIFSFSRERESALFYHNNNNNNNNNNTNRLKNFHIIIIIIIIIERE